MLYALAVSLYPYMPWIRVFSYVSVRAGCALLTSLGLSLLFGNRFIALSSALFRSKVRPFTPETHKIKDNIPTMGGLFILFVTSVTLLLWCDYNRPDTWLCMMTLVGFGLLGFIDDMNKVMHNKGISARTKFISQLFLAFIIILAWLYVKNPSTQVFFPFFKSFHPELGLLFIPWAMFVLVGTSNAVNLTDGLDGLAIGSLLSCFSVFSLIAYLAGHYAFAWYLHIPFAHTAELAVIGSTLVGSSLGFLWFNAHPAQIFMGDVGSLSLGAILAMMALLSKQELLLLISGGLFVIETVSVIAQLFMLKKYGRRIFKMAPIHHHFELLGWHEPKITVRFNIISVVLCLLALMTLKFR